MNYPFVSRIGGIISADIAVPEQEHEQRFYSRVLGTGDPALWQNDLLNSEGNPVIGLGERIPEYANLPLQWMPHIQVADVAASVKEAVDLNGKVLMHGKDEEGNSQWAVLLDPNGAGFGLIPVVPPESLPPKKEGSLASTGSIAWVDLTVSNAPTLRDFYHRVVGWTIEEIEMQDGDDSYNDYNMLGGDGNPAAGICHARGVNHELPPVWLLYLPVGDINESLRRVQEEGGRIIKKSRNDDGSYAYVVIQDPIGIAMALTPATI